MEEKEGWGVGGGVFFQDFTTVQTYTPTTVDGF